MLPAVFCPLLVLRLLLPNMLINMLTIMLTISACQLQRNQQQATDETALLQRLKADAAAAKVGCHAVHAAQKIMVHGPCYTFVYADFQIMLVNTPHAADQMSQGLCCRQSTLTERGHALSFRLACTKPKLKTRHWLR